MTGNSASKKRCPCRTATPRSNRKARIGLMMPVRWLTNRSVPRLQVELIGGLCRHEPHRWPLHRLGDRFRIAEVVFLLLRIGANVLGRHQSGIVTKTLELIRARLT